ncbi:MAG: sulfotransferase [Pyrinomonadaceae bacterium MAG19_C2-C3]|nr:sulfotransferase [Pyrinomonadaceae bacterium MAG19_C2-C3]
MSASFSHTKACRPVFVVGYMQSGTTLLLRILSRHSSVFTGAGETKFYDHLHMLRKRYANLKDEETLKAFVGFVVHIVKHGWRLGGENGEAFAAAENAREENAPHVRALIERAREVQDHAEIFPLVCDHLRHHAGKTRWLEKTPTHILHIDEIVASVPDALFVEIIRDVRDVLASKKTRRRDVWESDRHAAQEKKFKHLEKAYDPLWDALSWKSCARAGRQAAAKHSERYISIRYEDLVRAPEEVMRKVCAFLDMPFEPEMLQIGTRNSAERGERAGEGISADAVERWRRILTVPEVALCQSVVKTELAEHGYAPGQIPFSARTKVPSLVAHSMFEFTQRLSRRWRMGGSLYLFNVISLHWRRFRKIVHN